MPGPGQQRVPSHAVNKRLCDVSNLIYHLWKNSLTARPRVREITHNQWRRDALNLWMVDYPQSSSSSRSTLTTYS